MTRQPQSDSTYFPALDGLRAVAFLMVFATHYLQMPWGWTGVNMFFVLSGFLITGILFDTHDRPHRVWNFYLRRTLRIFPLYYGIMLLLVLVYPIFRWEWSWRWLIWPAYLGNLARLFTPHSAAASMVEFAQPLSRSFPKVQLALGHLWSLCVEEQFYLVWPCVVFAAKGVDARRRLIAVCIAGIVSLPLLRILANHMLSAYAIENASLLTVTPLPCDALLLGALIALIRRGPHAGSVLPVTRIVFTAIIVGLALRLVTSNTARLAAFPRTYSDHPAGTFTLGVTLIDLLAACLLVMALEPRSFTFRALNLAPLRWLGRISYGAYVFHDIFHGQFVWLAQRYTGHWKIAAAALAFGATLVLAWASFRWFETPFIRLKERWTRRSESDPQQTEASAPELLSRVA